MKKANNTLILILNKIFNNKIFSNKIFSNKITLIVVAAIAFLSLYRHIMLYEFSAVLLFFVVAALAYSFTKNMTVVLGTSFLATMFVSMFKGLLGFKEGMESNASSNPLANMQKMAEDMVSKSKEPKESAESTESAESAESAESTETDELTTSTRALTSTRAPKAPKAPKAPTAPPRTTATGNKNATEQSSTNGYQNQIPLTPGLYTMPNKEQMTRQLGKASETEQAYDNLEKIMGQKNIQSMSSDTQDLIRQQNDLIKQLKSMTPAINEAMNALGGIDLSKLTNIFNKSQEKAE